MVGKGAVQLLVVRILSPVLSRARNVRNDSQGYEHFVYLVDVLTSFLICDTFGEGLAGGNAGI